MLVKHTHTQNFISVIENKRCSRLLFTTCWVKKASSKNAHCRG